ncbi:response regulator transcription factor [Ramlibacter sp. PS3R-8]|uniref:response regulator transcription factor n=1 Tax=Ramlibacter sp. PS3R-8 TaxID=3133437 RepID=UPI0030B229D1
MPKDPMPSPAADAPPIRIVLADDHGLVMFGMKALLCQIPEVVVVAEARDGAELVAAVDSLRPDIVLTDISMPGMDGLTAIAELHQRHPKVRLVVVSAHDTVSFVRRAVKSGACGYLTKDASSTELANAVRSVMATGSYFSGFITRQLLQPAEPTAGDELTERQVEILGLLARGMASKQIAHQLGLSSKTVDVHRARMMARLGVHDVAGLTRYAIRMNLVQP